MSEIVPKKQKKTFIVSITLKIIKIKETNDSRNKPNSNVTMNFFANLYT